MNQKMFKMYAADRTTFDAKAIKVFLAHFIHFSLLFTIHKQNKNVLLKTRNQRHERFTRVEWKSAECQCVHLKSMFQYSLVTRLVKDKKF